MISAVNARGEFWAVTYSGKLNAEAFVVFLDNFMQSWPGKVFLVVDGHPNQRNPNTGQSAPTFRLNPICQPLFEADS